MKPFNLKDALAGKPVITRSGKPVTQILFFDRAHQNHEYPVYALVGDIIHSYTSDGSYDKTNPHEFSLDLLMAPEKKEVWINVYGRDGKVWVGKQQHVSESAGLEHSKKLINSGNYIKSIKIHEYYE